MLMSYIFSGLIIVSVLFGFLSGNVKPLSDAVLSSSRDAVFMVLELMGAMCFWTGLMKIAERAGVISAAAKLLKPVTKIIFPDVPENSKAMSAIVSNMVANILGLSNAATPLGLAAMKELDSLNKNRGTASDAMCMFVVVNTASLSLFPTTLITLLNSAKSESPFDVIIPIWICSIIAFVCGTLAGKILANKSKPQKIILRRAA